MRKPPGYTKIKAWRLEAGRTASKFYRIPFANASADMAAIQWALEEEWDPQRERPQVVVEDKNGELHLFEVQTEWTPQFKAVKLS